jgi:hypothetical protein
MTENVMGAYNATHPPGHPSAGKHCTNSGTCIIVFCYMNGLGKVLLKGKRPKSGRPDFVRFKTFVSLCMKDFLKESDERDLKATPKGKYGGDEWLYEVFRCGFVHGYPDKVAWGRRPSLQRYWYDYRGRLVLNIDELVRGFERGIEEFRRIVAVDPDIRNHFGKYIVAK